MPLSVISFATYLTRGSSWTDDDHNSLKFVKAVKGKTFGGWATVPVLGRQEKLRSTNVADAVEWFGELGADELGKIGLAAPVFIVPVPNSDCTVQNRKSPRTALLAEAVASRLTHTRVWDGLRWVKKETPTHQEGTRDPELLYPNLVLTSTPPKGTFVLVDDVFTKGGHLQAAAARLAEQKIRCKWAVCAGRTVLISEPRPFSILRQEIPDFVPATK
jgi:hypothetical protein